MEIEDRLIIDNTNKIEEVSQSDDGTYISVKFAISDFSVNANGKKINEDKFDDWKDTIIMKPLVGKIKLNKDNEEDFTSHQAKKVYKLENNQIVQRYKFGTDAFGTFEDISVEEIDGVNTIVATARVWTRFEKCCEIIERKFANGEELHTSWEIAIVKSHEEMIEGRKVTVIDNGVFLGHALLGKYVNPAYQCSKALEVAEEDEEIEMFNALISDIEELSSCSDYKSVEDNKENKGGIAGMEKENNIELSSLTTEDLCSRVRRAIYNLESNGRYYWNVLVYPYDFVAYAKIDGGDSKEEDWCKFTFTVNSDDTISLGNPEDVQMVFIPKATVENKETEIAETNSKLQAKETELSEKVEEIINLGNTINTLNESISEKDKVIAELEPYKEAIAEQKAKEEEAKIEAQKLALSEKLISSNYFTQEEIDASEEIKVAISELDENKINSILANKVVAKAQEIAQQKIETSEKEEIIEKEDISSDIESESESDYTVTGNIISDWLKLNR